MSRDQYLASRRKSRPGSLTSRPPDIFPWDRQLLHRGELRITNLPCCLLYVHRVQSPLSLIPDAAVYNCLRRLSWHLCLIPKPTIYVAPYYQAVAYWSRRRLLQPPAPSRIAVATAAAVHCRRPCLLSAVPIAIEIRLPAEFWISYLRIINIYALFC